MAPKSGPQQVTGWTPVGRATVSPQGFIKLGSIPGARLRFEIVPRKSAPITWFTAGYCVFFGAGGEQVAVRKIPLGLSLFKLDVEENLPLSLIFRPRSYLPTLDCAVWSREASTDHQADISLSFDLD